MQATTGNILCSCLITSCGKNLESCYVSGTLVLPRSSCLPTPSVTFTRSRISARGQAEQKISGLYSSSHQRIRTSGAHYRCCSEMLQRQDLAKLPLPRVNHYQKAVICYHRTYGEVLADTSTHATAHKAPAGDTISSRVEPPSCSSGKRQQLLLKGEIFLTQASMPL